MSATKRLRAPLIVMFGVIMAVLTFAGPANAAGPYPPPAGTEVLGTSASTGASVQSAPAAGTSSSASGLAFTGANAIGIGALGGVLLVGGGAMVLVGKRRKVNA
jgi:hypothetical protein